MSWIKGEAVTLPYHFSISICLSNMGFDGRVREKNVAFKMRCY